MWKYIKKSGRNFPKHPVSLSAVAGPSCFSGCAAILLLGAHVSSQPCPEPHTTASVTGCWAPMLEPGQEEAAGGEGDKSHPGTCKPPCAHTLMACVPLGLAQLPGGQWAQVSGGQPWGDPGITREVVQVMSIWIPATILVAS